MTIHNEADEEGTKEAYQKMYEKYGNLSYSEAYSIMQDAIGILETKCLLELDRANLSTAELATLMDQGKSIGELAKTSEHAIEQAKKRHDYLTK